MGMLDTAKKIPRKISEVGIVNTIQGGVKREYYKSLCKKYHANMWHMKPYELREYAQVTAKYVNERHPKTVVDVGCGFGEVVRHIHAETRYGFDIAPEQIQVAKLLAKGENITYQVGSFDDVNIQEPIDYLIAMNFMHGAVDEFWRPLCHSVAQRNDIRHFIVETIPEGKYPNSHYNDFTKVLPGNYKLIDRMGPFHDEAYVEVYEKTAQTEEKGKAE